MVIADQRTLTEATLAAALGYHRTGRFTDALALYRKILLYAPQHPDALHLLGLVVHQQGDNQAAIRLIRRAVQLCPAEASFLGSQGLVLSDLGSHQQAIASFHQATALRPNYAVALYNLGNTLQKAGDIRNAIDSFSRALDILPDFADARINLGNAYTEQGNLQQAANCYRDAIKRSPSNVDARFNLANTLKLLGNLQEAEYLFTNVLLLHPGHTDACNNLGNVFQAAGKHPEAIFFYQRARKLDGCRADILNNMGNTWQALGNAGLAYRFIQTALCFRPDFAEAYNNLANLLKDQARMPEALQSFARAHLLNPLLADVFSNWLLTGQYLSGVTQTESFARHRRFADLYESPLRPMWPDYTGNVRTATAGKALKVGYVSADFREHPAANFVLPVFECHDRKKVEIYCYYNELKQDSITARLMKAADHWLACQGMTDEHLVERIRQDRIDILIDLSGHSAGGRLQVFAQKAAPVQASYLGYVATTGLSGMDYRLTQGDVDPPGSERYYSEILYRLPGELWWCYRPLVNPPAPGPLPAVENGFVTFGSTNNVAKLTPEVVALWSSILRKIPSARLLIAGVPPGSAKCLLLNKFAAHGILPERLMIHGRLPPRQYVDLHEKIDIALDPFPYNGGTTSCDALWMGLPFVSLIGDSFVSRMGYALLKSIGLVELAAVNEQAYIDIAIALATDLPRLSSLREGMRTRIFASPLCDEIGFTRKLEEAYSSMWATFCQRRVGDMLTR